MPVVKYVLTILTSLLLVACKIQINVPAEGGSVGTASGNYSCGAGQQCVIEVKDALFSESFFADADQGYSFAGWKKAALHFCGGTDGSCALSTAFFAGNMALLDFLQTDAVFFLEPQFETFDSGGAVYAEWELACDTWTGSGISDNATGQLDDGEIGVTDEMFDVPGECDTDLFTYEVSPSTGERRLQTQGAWFRLSVQGEDPYYDTEVFRYAELIRQGVAVDRLTRVDTYASTTDVPPDPESDDSITSSYVFGYETSPSSQGRPISYQEWERVDDGSDFPPLIVTSEETWDYEDDGSVRQSEFRLYDEDLGYINGQVRYVVEGNAVVAYRSATIFGAEYDIGKTVYPGRGQGDLLVPLPPPTGQVYTENAWTLPSAFTNYVYDLETGEEIGDLKVEITRVSNAGYPLESTWSLWNEETGDWQVETTNQYGYATDSQGTVYWRYELETNSDGPSQAFVRRFRADLFIIDGTQ